LENGLQRALFLFGDRERYLAVQQRGMRKDFSWERAVGKYERLYADAV